MGTRNITIVIKDGKHHIAQYCQWDGYPEGQGYTALKFLARCNLDKFRKSLDLVSFFDITADADEIEKIELSTDFERNYRYLTRDMGADILKYIHKNKKPIKLIDQYEFTCDSLFCEWAYVVDLDKNTFEVYTGFNKSLLDPSERFYNQIDEGKIKKSLDLYRDYAYYPVRHVISFDLNALPTKRKFLSKIKKALSKQ